MFLGKIYSLHWCILHVNALICTVFSLYFVGMTKSCNYCMYSLYCTYTLMEKKISINRADCAFTLHLQNSLGTIKLLPHCHTLAAFPGLPLLHIIVNANGTQKRGRPGNGASHILYPSIRFNFVLCCFLYSSSPFHDSYWGEPERAPH